MSKPWEEFKQWADKELLKALLEVYNPAPNISQDQKISLLITKLDEVFKENLDETHTD